jgi:DNA-binding beta-propeller fold protein YncE
LTKIFAASSEVNGLTILDHYLCVVRRPTREQVEIYDTNTFSRQTALQVAGLGEESYGLASCSTNKCLYVSDFYKGTIYKITMSDGESTAKWETGCMTVGLSVNNCCHILAVCWHKPDKISEFTTDGQLIREIKLPSLMLSPEHAVQLTNDLFVVSHGNRKHGTLHRVCIVDAKGHYIHHYGHNPGTDLDNPRRLAVSTKGLILVADMGNDRILALNSTLKLHRPIAVSVDGRLKRPYALYLDESRDRLYVGEEAGRILVFGNVVSSLQQLFL